MAEFASKGVAGTGLGLGAGALGLMLLGGNNGGCCNNGGLFSGILGGNNCCTVNEKELNLSTALSIAQSEKYTSEKSTENLKELYAETLRLNAIQRETDTKIATGLIETGNALGVLNADVKCLQREIDRNREESTRNFIESKQYAETLVHSEARERICGDEKNILYVNGELAKKIDGTLMIDGSEISYGSCKPVLQSCPCGSTANPYNVTVVE